MDITVIVCTFKRYNSLSNTIASLLKQKNIQRFDILILDNSGNDEVGRQFALDYLNNDNVEFKYLSQPGLSNARNTGANSARGDIVAYIDDDAIASETWVCSLLDAFEAFGADTGVVGGPVTPIWGETPPKWLSKRALDMLSLVDRGPDMRVMEPHEWLAGCNIAFNRKMLLDVGGFDPALGRNAAGASLLGNEEYQVCERLMQRGKKMVYAPDAVVRHCIEPERVNADWLVKRMTWQAISDAISNPERSAVHASWKDSKLTDLQKRQRVATVFLLMSGIKKSLSDDDLEAVYDQINHLICSSR